MQRTQGSLKNQVVPSGSNIYQGVIQAMVQHQKPFTQAFNFSKILAVAHMQKAVVTSSTVPYTDKMQNYKYNHKERCCCWVWELPENLNWRETKYICVQTKVQRSYSHLKPVQTSIIFQLLQHKLSICLKKSSQSCSCSVRSVYQTSCCRDNSVHDLVNQALI